MTRTILTIGAFVVATFSLFTATAQACISCNYTPEVVNTPVKKPMQAARPQQRKKATVARKSAPAKQRAAKDHKVAKTAASKVEPTPKKVITEKAETTETPAPAETNLAAETQDSSRLTGSSALMQSQLQAKQEEEQPASKDAAPAPAVEEKATCKKFFPAIGATLTVACD